MSRRIAVFINPVAGNADVAALFQLIEECQHASDDIFATYETQAHTDFELIVSGELAQGCERFIVAGGDGTIAEVARHLLKKDVELGIVPSGTANILAKHLNIPADASEAFTLAITEAHTRPVDVLSYQDKILLVHVSMGSYSKIADSTSADDKQRLGRMAYFVGSLPHLLAPKNRRYRLEIDGELHHLRASFVLITNAAEVGAFDWRWTENSSVDDGVIEVCVVTAKNLLDYVRYVVNSVFRRADNYNGLTVLQARRSIRISSHKRDRIRGDGELLDSPPLDLMVVPAALKIICQPTCLNPGTRR